MVNYNNGKIYKIVDNTNNNIYVGSTTKKYLSQRLDKHRGDYKQYLKNKYSYVTSYKILENNDYDIVLLELVNCETKDELHKRERYFIETLDCVNKIIPGRTHKEYREANRDKLIEKCKDWRKDNIEAVKLYNDKNKEKTIQYRLDHKEKVKEVNIEYYKNNKVKILDYHQEYYNLNKEKIKLQWNEKKTCICGCEYTHSNYTRHCKSKKHLNYIALQV